MVLYTYDVMYTTRYSFFSTTSRNSLDYSSSTAAVRLTTQTRSIQHYCCCAVGIFCLVVIVLEKSPTRTVGWDADTGTAAVQPAAAVGGQGQTHDHVTCCTCVDGWFRT